MFIHRDPPPTPEEVFVTGTSAPFVCALAAPDQAWLDTQKKIAAHLGGDGTSTRAPLFVPA